MHYGLIIGANGVGGIERQMQLLARGLMAAGEQVTVIYSDSPRQGFRRPLARSIDYSGIPLLELCSRKWFRNFYFPYGRFEVKRRKIDLLIGNNPSNAYVGAVLAKGTDIPLITHISGMKFSRQGEEATREQLRYCIQNSKMVISNAQVALDTAAQMGLIQGQKTKVIHNAIQAPRQQTKPCTDRFHVIYVGSLYHIKDPMTLIRALELAKKRLPVLTATLVGDGVMRQEIQDYLDQNSLNSFIRLTGHIPTEQIPYSESDLFVNCSVSELSSGQIAEGLSHGLTAIGSHVGGTPEILEGHDFSATFPPQDVNALADLIVKFGSKSVAERTALGDQAKAYANGLFSMENYVKSYIELGKMALERD